MEISENKNNEKDIAVMPKDEMSEPSSPAPKKVEPAHVQKASGKKYLTILVLIVVVAGLFYFLRVGTHDVTGSTTALPAGGEQPSSAAAANGQEAALPPKVDVGVETTPSAVPKSPPRIGAGVDCRDNNACTTDTYDRNTGQCTNSPIANCCGNGICEEGERCSATTHQTTCPQDCSLSCPPELTFSKVALSGTPDKFSYVCSSGACEEVGDNEFKITGKAVIHTFINNWGEQATTSPVSAQAFCTYGAEQTSVDGTAGGIEFKNYFDGGSMLSKLINAKTSRAKDNYAEYLLQISPPVDIGYNIRAYCTILLQSQDGSNSQNVVFVF